MTSFMARLDASKIAFTCYDTNTDRLIEAFGWYSGAVKFTLLAFP
jgi:hypothetical protein